jgi:hypothetical protein
MEPFVRQRREGREPAIPTCRRSPARVWTERDAGIGVKLVQDAASLFGSIRQMHKPKGQTTFVGWYLSRRNVPRSRVYAVLHHCD